MKNKFFTNLNFGFAILFLPLFLPLAAQAGGLISLKGNILGCDKKICQLKVDSQIYKLELAKLNTKQASYLLSKKIEDSAELSLSLSAVQDVIDYTR